MKRALVLALLLVPAPARAQSAPPPAAPPPAPRSVASFRLAAGIDYRRIYDFGMTTGHLAFAVAIERPNLRSAGFFSAEVQGGATEYGLSVVDVRLGGGQEWRFGRFRPGFGIEAGVLTVERATTTTNVNSLWLGGYGFASFDLIDLGEGDAIYVAGKLDFDLIGAPPSPFVWGPSAQVGFRF